MTPPMIYPTSEEKEEVTNANVCRYEVQKLSVTTSPTEIYSTVATPNKEHNTRIPHISPLDFRVMVRNELYTAPTKGICPENLQCNLVVLPRVHAFDFLLFCQRNPKACPLIEACPSPIPSSQVAKHANLQTDLPRYSIYKNGKLEKEVSNVQDCWPKDGVAFLLGCSFSFDHALQQAGIVDNNKQQSNVAMFQTNLTCRPAGIFKGNIVVSMRLIKAQDVAEEVRITSQYPHAHGAPICVGCPASIGITDIYKPDWGVAPPLAQADQVPVFHACGVTSQQVILESNIDYCITHSPGHMFVTDLPANKVYP